MDVWSIDLLFTTVQLSTRTTRFTNFNPIHTRMCSTVFASIYAWVQGRQYSYSPEDWQRCLVAPNKGGVGAGGWVSRSPLLSWDGIGVAVVVGEIWYSAWWISVARFLRVSKGFDCVRTD